MKKILLAVCLIFLSGCRNGYSKYECDFSGVFDTYTVIIGYAKTEKEFTMYANEIYNKLEYLSKLYDIYNDYEGINNLKTINDNAGIRPVRVEPEIIELLKVCKRAYYDTDGAVDISLGPVLSIWHDYRDAGLKNPESAELPPMDLLTEAYEYCNIDKIIIDEDAGTVYLEDAEMSIDVGAVAKGYAVDMAKEAAAAIGFKSGLISCGGNVCAIGAPLDGVREKWGVGIQNPQLDVYGNQNIIDTVFVNDLSVVSSGDYQRYYTVGGKAYNHIIDPRTMMPAEKYKAVTVVHNDSKTADILSTAIFILPYEDGHELLKKSGAEAMWIFHDESIKVTDGFK